MLIKLNCLVSGTFNVCDLLPYYDDDLLPSSSLEGENDGGSTNQVAKLNIVHSLHSKEVQAQLEEGQVQATKPSYVTMVKSF